MNTAEHWQAFCAVNEARRSIRHFDGTALDDDDVEAILAAAALAPSSMNCQPYTLHWVKSPQMRERLAAACNGQRAAQGAGAFIVVVADPRVALNTKQEHLAAVLADETYNAAGRAYHTGVAKELRRLVGVGSTPLLSPVVWLLSLVWPALTLLPLHPRGLRHWCARSAIYAAQTLLLAATARGIASCPMEGFHPLKVASVLGLPRGSVVPLVIALGHATPNARIEPRWRRATTTTVVQH